MRQSSNALSVRCATDGLTVAAEAQARTGHDVIPLGGYQPNHYATVLEPVDDVVVRTIRHSGAASAVIDCLGKADRQWVAVPATSGSQLHSPCSRIDLLRQHSGIDVQPERRRPEDWNNSAA